MNLRKTLSTLTAMTLLSRITGLARESLKAFAVGAVWQLYSFFSSRRRHTRFDCDWSSDVCSSDLCDLVELWGIIVGVDILHDAARRGRFAHAQQQPGALGGEIGAVDLRRRGEPRQQRDRKSTRLNSSHSQISYAVFCLKKKTNTTS